MTVVDEGFSVDLVELEGLAREFLAVADAARDHVAWKFDIDASRWPQDDPLRDAVIAYQRSLREAMDRLCGGAERTAGALREVVAEYRDTDHGFAVRLESLAGVTEAGDHGGRSTASP